MTNNIIDFSKKKLEKERKEYELNLDTEIITTRREIEELATDIVMEFAELWEIDQLIAEKIYEKEYMIQLHEAFPKQVNPINLSFSSNEVMKLQVVIAYSRWQRIYQ